MNDRYLTCRFVLERSVIEALAEEAEFQHDLTLRGHLDVKPTPDQFPRSVCILHRAGRRRNNKGVAGLYFCARNPTVHDDTPEISRRARNGETHERRHNHADAPGSFQSRSKATSRATCEQCGPDPAEVGSAIREWRRRYRGREVQHARSRRGGATEPILPARSPPRGSG